MGKMLKIRKTFSMILLALTLFACGHIFFHHHADLSDHPDCAICQVMHKVVILAAVPILSITFSRVMRFAELLRPSKIISEFYPYFLSRAPPAIA